jgi:hypothetical protein
MFAYSPMTEKECNEERGFKLLDEGVYDFEVLTANFRNSKSGNPMIELKLRVWGNDGKDYLVFDYLVATSKMMWKTKHFCDSVGLSKEYEASKFSEELCPGKCGKASITYQVGSQKPGGGYYPDKNSVSDYVVTDKGSVKYESPKANVIDDDEDIPF